MGNSTGDGGTRNDGVKMLLAELAADQEQRAATDRLRLVEVYLAEHPDLEQDPDAVVELLMREYRLRRARNEQPTISEYLVRFPQLRDRLEQQFIMQQWMGTDWQMGSADPNETIPLVHDESALSRDRLQPTIGGYEIVGELGRGGMGVVYKAKQLSLNRIVALKVISERDHATKNQLWRFRREAEALAKLQHPNIVQVYEIAECNDVAYFAMEYVDGGDLAEVTAKATLPAQRVAELLETLARAIHAAHGQALVHRDLKPANILLTIDGQPKITDFGLVKHLEQETTQTQTGVLFPSGFATAIPAAGDTIVYAKMGLRVGLGDNIDVFAGYGRPLTGDRWYDDIARVEIRLRY